MFKFIWGGGVYNNIKCSNLDFVLSIKFKKMTNFSQICYEKIDLFKFPGITFGCNKLLCLRVHEDCSQGGVNSYITISDNVIRRELNLLQDVSTSIPKCSWLQVLTPEKIIAYFKIIIVYQRTWSENSVYLLQVGRRNH